MGQMIQHRRVSRTGIRVFRDNWFYEHDLMKNYVGEMVKVFVDEKDFSKVGVEMPSGELVEAKLKSVVSKNSRTIKHSCEHLAEVIEIQRHALDRIVELGMVSHGTVHGLSMLLIARDAIKKSDQIFLLRNQQISKRNGEE